MEQIIESLSALLIPLEDEFGAFSIVGAALWLIFIAVAVGFIVIRIQSATLGKIVKILREKKAFTAETALPLSTFEKFPSALFSGSGTLFAKVEKDSEERIYLPEKSNAKATALLKFGSTRLRIALPELLGLYALLYALYYILSPLLHKFAL
ncbi:MAG: hypothetical protein E7580_08715 [Ruminococcaceae bacterium]|nr:hypothetical protein [Oscillospiraceae bacterium]